jgi:hypothetical protein
MLRIRTDIVSLAKLKRGKLGRGVMARANLAIESHTGTHVHPEV